MEPHPEIGTHHLRMGPVLNGSNETAQPNSMPLPRGRKLHAEKSSIAANRAGCKINGKLPDTLTGH